MLPYYIQHNLATLLNEHKLGDIQKSALALTQIYRENREQISNCLNTKEKILAYLSMRMPATYAAVYKVLSEILKSQNKETIQSVLDIGAGPGTATCAALELFPELKSAHLIEANAEIIALGKKLFNNHEHKLSLHWQTQNYMQNWELENTFDLSIFSYTLNEVPSLNHIDLIQKVWHHTRKYLVIIEPGSKHSFEFMNSIRNFCIEKNISILAPCPHTQACPAYVEKDWCHFAARVPRSSTHRALKEAEKNYEDEKFSYLILSRETVAQYTSRIVRRPVIKPGNVQIKLCTEKGFSLRTLSKKDGEIYKQTKKLDWGDFTL